MEQVHTEYDIFIYRIRSNSSKMNAQTVSEPKKKEGLVSQSTSSKLRITIYEVLVILLKEEDSGVLMLSILRLIDFFQLMAFPFSGDAQFPWKASSIYDSLVSVIEIFQIVKYLSDFPWYTYLIVFYMGIMLVVLVILDIVYVLYSISRKKFTFIWPLKALTGFCSIFLTVLFLPLLSIPFRLLRIELFVSMISCKKSATSADYVHTYYPEITCWRGAHIAHAIMAIAVSAVFIVIALIVTLTFYEARAFTSNAGARYFSRIGHDSSVESAAGRTFSWWCTRSPAYSRLPSFMTRTTPGCWLRSCSRGPHTIIIAASQSVRITTTPWHCSGT